MTWKGHAIRLGGALGTNPRPHAPGETEIARSVGPAGALTGRQRARAVSAVGRVMANGRIPLPLGPQSLGDAASFSAREDTRPMRDEDGRLDPLQWLCKPMLHDRFSVQRFRGSEQTGQQPRISTLHREPMSRFDDPPGSSGSSVAAAARPPFNKAHRQAVAGKELAEASRGCRVVHPFGPPTGPAASMHRD